MDLDTLVKETIKRVVEGGKALGGDRIAQRDVQPTIDAFAKQVLAHIPHRSVHPLGSTGQKLESGDIDLAIDTDLDPRRIAEIVGELGFEKKLFPGLDQVSVLFPQHGPDELRLPRWVQIDLIKGDPEYLKWSHPSPADSKYKGFYTRAIANAIIRATTGEHVNVSRGIFRGDDPEKKYSTDLGSLAKRIGRGWTSQDLTMSLEKIWDKAKKTFSPEQLDQIREYVREFMVNKRAPFPEELNEAERSPHHPFERLQDAIVANLPRVKRITDVPPGSIRGGAVFRPATMAIHVVSDLPEPWKSYAVAHEAGHVKDLDTPEKIRRAQELVRALHSGKMTPEEGREYLELEKRGWDNAEWFLRKAGIPVDQRFKSRRETSMKTHRQAIRGVKSEGLEDVVYEALANVARGIVPGYGNFRHAVPTTKPSGTQKGHGNIGGSRNRGKAGYPVPPELGTKRGAEGFEDPGIEVLEKKEEKQHKGTCVMLPVPMPAAEVLAALGGTEPPEEMHITLFYKKGLTKKQIDKVEAIMGDLWTERAAPIDIDLQVVGSFDPSESSDWKKVIFAKVEEESVKKFRAELIRRLKEEGIEPDDTHPDFKPHITLAYIDPGEEMPISIDEPVRFSIDDFVVQRGIPAEELNEAVSQPEDLEFGIKHLDDLKPDEFMAFLKRYADEPLKLEISEKIDGSARMSFGVGGGTVWTQTKTGSRKATSSQYPDTEMFRAVKEAHKALETKRQQVIAAWPEGVSFMVAEVLYGEIPNAIEYGNNLIIIHGVHRTDGRTLGDKEAAAAAQQVVAALDGMTGDFGVEYKKTISPKDVMIPVRKEYDTLGQLYADLQKKPRDKETRTQFQKIQRSVKERMLKAIATRGSFYGQEGGDIEGLVFRDLESGQLYKLVDRDYFKKLNDFMWSWRNRLNKDVMGGFREVVARDVLGDEGAASNRLVGDIAKEADSPPGKTPEERADYAIAKYIAAHDLMKPDFYVHFQRSLMGAFEDITKLKTEWEQAKSREQTVTISGKTRVMRQGVKDRTTAAIQDAEAALQGIKAGMDVAGRIKDPMTQKVALFKLFMGHKFQRLAEKLSGSLDEGIFDPHDDTEERAKAMFPTGKPRNRKGAPTMAQIELVRAFGDKLERRLGTVVDTDSDFLGGGAHASAFDLHDGRVFKITNDVTDAAASAYFLKNPVKHVVKVFDAFEFPKAPGSWYTYYGIVVEKLFELDADEEQHLSKAGMYMDNVRGQSWNEVRANLEALHKQDIVELFRAYGLDQMVDEFAAAGFNTEDFHSGNVMKRADGTMVLSDLGYSTSSGDIGGLPKLEKKIYEGGPIDRMTGATDLSGAPRVDDVGLDDAQAANEAAGKWLKAATAATIMGLASPTSPPSAPKPDVTNIEEPIDIAPTRDDLVRAAARKHRISPLLIHAMINVESSGDPKAVSGAGAKGLMQLTPITVKHLGVKDPHDEAQAIEGGTRYIRQLLNRFKGKLDRALAAYNAGPTFVRKHGPESYPAETKEYIKRIRAEVARLKKLQGRKSGVEDVVKEVVGRVVEAIGDQYVGVTIGRYQPFHAGHAAIIRELARRYTRVIVFVAGLKNDKQNPFSYDLRLKMMEKSLPDVWTKIRVYPARIQDRGTGYVPGLIANVAQAGDLDPRQPVTILVGEDRIGAVKQQVEHNKKYEGQPGYFLGSMDVEALPGVKSDDEAGRISGTRVRKAIADGNRKEVVRLLDPHLVSDPGALEELLATMESEMKRHGPAPKPKMALEAIVEEVIAELGMGGLETGAGWSRGGAWGSSGWSRAVLAGDEDGDEVYQQMMRSPSTRMLPMANPGTPNSDLPGQNRVDREEDQADDLSDPTDLGEAVERAILNVLRRR